LRDNDRSKEDLISELKQLRKRNLELELCLKEKFTSNSSSPLYDSCGNITHAIVVFEDLSELKRTHEGQEKLLAEVNEKRGILQSIIESMPVGLWIAGAGGEMLLINDNARQIWGGSAPYAGSVDEYEVYNARWSDTGEKILSEDMPMARALRGETLKEVALDFERFDGTQGTQLVSAAPIRDSKDCIIGCVGIAQDITQRRLVEKALHISEERFRTVLKGSPVVVFSQDLELRYTWAYNPSPGFKVEAVLGKRDDEIYSPDDASFFMKIKKEVITSGTSRRDEVITHRPDSEGGDLIHDMITEPLHDKDGRIIGVTCVAIDITTQKKNMELHLTNVALQKTIEMKDDFLSIISHEFRTPLNVINTAIQAMSVVCADKMTDKVKEYIRIIRQNTFRQIRLVNNLLDITRAMTGHIKINKKNIDIVFLTKAITESVYQFASQKGVSITFTSTFGMKIIGMDDEKYERIILNLLSNAIKFTPKGKSIVVSMRSLKGRVCVEVKDTGIGIPPHKTNLIFEKFGQVDSSLSRQAEGSGIGLSLVKRLVEALDGSISVKSKVGKGSTFTILFPDETVVEEKNEKPLADLMNSRLIDTMNVEFSDIYL
jgi:PAS domain S-box-containing protein